MSAAFNDLANGEALVERLLPKMTANHVSKLPELEGVSYSTVLDLVSDPSEPLADRLRNVANFVGNTTLTDTLIQEVNILKLVATGREAEVDDDARQAAYPRSDGNQQRDAVSEKDLDYYLRNGIEIIFDRESRDAAHRYCQLDGRNVPLIEKLKAKRLFSINGFNDSRVMYAVHDMIDHAWLFDQMRETGIMYRYDDFLQTIEMGDRAFLYSRQAELLASVGFGSRRWAVARSQGEGLVLGAHDIASILQGHEDPRTAIAAKRLEEMAPHERQQAVFMVENMAIQFADERRRWGSVKVVDTDSTRKPMSLLDPVHVALMVETLRMLQTAKNYGAIQLAATVEVEKVLAEAISDRDTSGSLYFQFQEVGAMISLK